MPLSKQTSHKASRKWLKIGKKNKWIKLENGCSNKRPIIKLKNVLKEYLEDE